MSETLPIRHTLKGISPKAYEHPADRAATAALHAVPGLDQVVRKLIEFQYERALRQSLLASGLKLGEDQLPEIWGGYLSVLRTLDMDETYDLYLTNFPLANSVTIGAEKPMILMNSGLVSVLDPDEVRTVLAHEVGHVLSDHVMYFTALMILLRLGPGRMPLLAGLPLRAIRMALLEWSRAAELTCDRAATLVNRDPLLTCRTLMALAAGMKSSKLNLDAFLRQASDYERWDSEFDRLTRFFWELRLTHDVPVRRVSELTKWVRSGHYDRIIGGDFRTRAEDVDARAEAGEAVTHYTERFRAIFRDAGEGVASAGERMADWLRKAGR